MDPCAQMFTVSVENFRRNVSLINYSFGELEEHWLLGIVRLR